MTSGVGKWHSSLESDFEVRVGLKFVCPFRDHSSLSVEIFDDSVGNLAFSPEPVADERLVASDRPTHPLHRFNLRSYRHEEPSVEEAPRPGWALIFPERLERLLEQVLRFQRFDV